MNSRSNKPNQKKNPAIYEENRTDQSNTGTRKLNAPHYTNLRNQKIINGIAISIAEKTNARSIDNFTLQCNTQDSKVSRNINFALAKCLPITKTRCVEPINQVNVKKH